MNVREMARQIRINSVKMVYEAGSGHLEGNAVPLCDISEGVMRSSKMCEFPSHVIHESSAFQG